MDIIIIDGPDAIGKGTVIEELKKLGNYVPVKATIPPKDKTKNERVRVLTDYSTTLRTIESIQKTIAPPIWVLDRFYPSEYVYGKIRRDYNPEKNFWDIETEVLKNNVLYVYCVLDKDEHEKRFDDRKDDITVKDELRKLVEKYNKFYNKTKMKKMKIDTKESPAENAKKISEAFSNNKV